MAQLKKILLVDDDDDLRDALSEQLLLTEDFDVFEAGNGADAKTRAAEALYDLVILDVGLPDIDGRDLCRDLRTQGVKSPILMLTGHDSDADTIMGLMRARMITSPSRSNSPFSWRASGHSCASTNNPKRRFSSLGRIRSSRRPSC